MARPVAGVRGQTVVIAVPGSPKGAKENVEAVIKLLPHACDLTAGGNSRTMHSERRVAESGTGVMEDSKRVGATDRRSDGGIRSHGHHHDHVGRGHGGVKPRTTEEQRKLLSNELGGKGTTSFSVLANWNSHSTTSRVTLSNVISQRSNSKDTGKYSTMPNRYSPRGRKSSRLYPCRRHPRTRISSCLPCQHSRWLCRDLYFPSSLPQF